jgi:hypothetical protein
MTTIRRPEDEIPPPVPADDEDAAKRLEDPEPDPRDDDAPEDAAG